MNAPHTPLFRREVSQHRASRLHGEVNIAVPVSWQLIGFAFIAALVAAMSFLSFASYSRVENVTGTIVLDRGIAPIVPTRSGIVTAIDAHEGQQVQTGARLIEIRSEEAMTGGSTGPRRVVGALEQQDRMLAAQGAMMLVAASSEQSRLVEQVAGLAREIGNIDEQITNQRRLVEVAENDYQSIAGVVKRGFISQRSLRTREEALLASRQQLSQIEQSRGAKTSQLAEVRRGIVQAGASAQAQAAGVAFSRAEVAQRLADVEAVRGYTLTSPIAGTVTAVTARLGQPVTQQGALMVIVPDDANSRAELFVPTNAAGFLAVGQEVRLAVKAFPYQRYGTVAARISEISLVAIPKSGPDGTAIPVYLLTAEIAQPWIVAFGRKQPLLPGMALNARIVTDQQSLIKWLFEPLFAVSER